MLPGRSHPFMHEHVPPWPHALHVAMFCATSTSSSLTRQHRSPFPVARLHDPRQAHFLHTSKMASPGHTLQSAAVVVGVVVGVVMATGVVTLVVGKVALVAALLLVLVDAEDVVAVLVVVLVVAVLGFSSQPPKV